MFFMFLLFPTVLSIMFLFFFLLLLLLLSMSLFTAVTITTMMSASALMSAPASFLRRVLFLVLCRLSVPIKMEIM